MRSFGFITVAVSVFIVVLYAVSDCYAQFGGNRAGAEQSNVPRHDFNSVALTVEEAQSVITVEGVAEIRVKPTQIRLVMAAVSEAKTANECKARASELVQSIQAGWKNLGIQDDDIFEDFISILPVYRHEEQKKNNVTVLQEVLDSYRFQTNLHVKLADNAQARKALNVAFGQNVTDIIAFDYWNPDLERSKTEALRKAIQVARTKAEIMFDPGLFERRPKLMNIREDFQTVFPADMYESYTNTVAQAVTIPYRFKENVPRISAPRPKTTYYRGPRVDGDSLSPELPMRPEISVVSRVRLYFESPFAEHDGDDEDDD